MTARPAPGLVESLLGRCRFPDRGELDLAVSGGADSSALLALASVLGRRLVVHHVDHALRPGSAREANVVAALAERFGAQFRAHRVEVGDGPNLEERARHARFSVLPAGVLTGHTLDDRAETMLINLLRGAGPSGMAALAGSERHPLVELRRHETQAVCAELGIDPVQDPSNSDPRFLRNRVRHELMPLAAELSGRDLAAVMARQGDIFAAEDGFVNRAASGVDGSDAKALAAADPVVARRAIRRHVTQSWGLGHPPDAAAVERYLLVARGEAKAAEIGRGFRVQRSQQRLIIVASQGSER